MEKENLAQEMEIEKPKLEGKKDKVSHPFEFDEEKQHIYNDTEIDFTEDNFEDFDEKEAVL